MIIFLRDHYFRQLATVRAHKCFQKQIHHPNTTVLLPRRHPPRCHSDSCRSFCRCTPIHTFTNDRWHEKIKRIPQQLCNNISPIGTKLQIKYVKTLTRNRSPWRCTKRGLNVNRHVIYSICQRGLNVNRNVIYSKC